MCKHWDLGCINKNSLTSSSGKPCLENRELYSKKNTDTNMNK